MQEHPLLGNPCQAAFNRGYGQAMAEINQKLINVYPGIWDMVGWVVLFATIFAFGWCLRGRTETRRRP